MPLGVKGFQKGNQFGNRFKKGHKADPWNKGLKNVYSVATREKMSAARKGRKLSDVHRGRISAALKRRPPPSLETRKKISEAQKGEKSYNWKGGISKVNEMLRKGVGYKIWRESVFERDDYTCQMCWKRGGELHADHIKRFADYPSLRFEISNGRTLCKSCHRGTRTYGNKRDPNLPQDYSLFLSKEVLDAA